MIAAVDELTQIDAYTLILVLLFIEEITVGYALLPAFSVSNVIEELKDSRSNPNNT